MSKGIRRFLLATTIYSSSLMGNPMLQGTSPATDNKTELNHLVSLYGVSYDYYLTPRGLALQKSPLRGVVLEDLVNPHNSWGVRHGHAVAAMADHRADSIAQADIQIDLVDEDALGVYFLNNPRSLLLTPIVDQADVVGLSYVLDKPKTAQLIQGHDVELYDQFWDDNRPLVIQSAGNSNNGSDEGLENEQATAMMRHGRYLQVGSVLENRDGRHYVPSYSARVGPAFVVDEGFDKDFIYKYLEDEASLRVRLGKLLNKDGNDAEVLMRGGRECANDSRITTTRRAWEEDRPNQDLKKAYNAAVTDCYVRHHNQAAQVFQHEDGQTGVRVLGTSFAQPEAMGMVLGTLDRYRNRLTRDDVMALTMLAAEPVSAIETTTSQIHDKLYYGDNGTGVLAYNFNIAGYGRLSVEGLAHHAAAMSALREQNPALTTVARRINSPWVQNQIPQRLSGALPDSPQQFVIDVTDDVLALNTMLQIRLSPGTSPQQELNPPTLTAVKLTSPQGITFEVPVTSGAHTLSFANSPAFMGNSSKGIWILTLPPGVEASEARLSVYGVERHGLIEAYIEQRRKQFAPHGRVNFDKPGLL